MKVFLLALITIILISYGLYKIITGFITVPSREIDKNIQNMQGTEGVLDDLKKLFISTPAKFIARFVNIDMYKRQKLSRERFLSTPQMLSQDLTITSRKTLSTTILKQTAMTKQRKE